MSDDDARGRAVSASHRSDRLALVAALWSKQGNEQVLCTPSSGDHGVDVVAISGDKGFLIQTKQSSVDGGRLGWDVVKEVLGGEAFYRRQFPNISFMKIGLTNQLFNANAHEHARLNEILLIERPGLQQLLERFCINLNEVERHLHGAQGMDATVEKRPEEISSG